MLSTDKGRMIIMSSQKTTQDNRDFIDVSTLRSSHVNSNHVYYVCPPHLKEMSSNGSIFNICLCYVFSQPDHINTGGSFKALTELFSRHSSNSSENDHFDSAMLSELGIDITMVNDDIQEMSLPKLCTRKAQMQLQTNPVHLLDIIAEQKTSTVLSDTIMVYIDPAPVSGDRSFNAICFATHLSHILPNGTSHKYIILALENFQSDTFDPDTNNYGIAVAKILMKDIIDIFSFYRGHFKNFIIAPEADSISMDHFWVKCQQLYAESRHLSAKNGPRIFFTAIKVSLNKNTKKGIIDNHQSYMEKEGLSVTSDSKKQELLTSKEKWVQQNEMSGNITSKNIPMDCTKYRVGYNLGQNKTKLYLDFFTTEYNSLNVFCALEVFGHTLSSKTISIPTFIAENLDILTLKATGSKNMAWKIHGKCQRKGVFITDDVADAVIMSIMLFKKTVNQNRSSYPLYELKPKLNSHGTLERYQSQEYVIMSEA